MRCAAAHADCVTLWKPITIIACWIVGFISGFTDDLSLDIDHYLTMRNIMKFKHHQAYSKEIQ